MKVTDAELGFIPRIVKQSLSAAAASVLVHDRDRDVLRVVTASGAGDMRVTGMELPGRRGIAGWAVDTGEFIVVRDVRSDSRFDLKTAAATGFIPETIMAMPVIDDGDVIAVLEVLDPELDGASDAKALGILSEFADHIARLMRR